MNKCRWCGAYHDEKCPIVKAIEYHQDGTVKRVEFLTPADQMQPLMSPPATVPQSPMYPQQPPFAPQWWPNTSCLIHPTSAGH